MALDHTAWWPSMPSPAALDVLTAPQPWDWGRTAGSLEVRLQGGERHCHWPVLVAQ